MEKYRKKKRMFSSFVPLILIIIIGGFVGNKILQENSQVDNIEMNNSINNIENLEENNILENKVIENIVNQIENNNTSNQNTSTAETNEI